ncbi:MAG: hypothetical protein Q8M58_00365 [Anaerolineales bacterium]|nr:hypothetical protein [Anaerolineales bacterium]
MEAAAEASRQTGSAIQVHTEKGQDAEKILEFFVGRGVPAERLVLCHMDKRPDFGLHSELARAGALLEYDTFFRPKYDPEHTLWPLLEQMVAGGWARSLALAGDLADARDWRVHGGRYGLSGLLTHVLPRLRQMGLPEYEISHLMGENIAQRLAR